MRYASRIDCLADKSLLNAFEIAETDEVISFSAGFPSSETYPLEAIKDSFNKVIEESGKEALSYCSTSGYIRLRETIESRLSNKFGLKYSLDEIIITSGSQQGLDMSGMLFVNKGDVVLFENPSYLGAVNSLRAHEAKLIAIDIDSDGICMDSLKKALDKYGEEIKMIYVNPDFQNPTGRSWSHDRRQEFMETMGKYDIPILEDAAYAELSFERKIEKPLAYYDKHEQVIYLGTFSKTFCPGLRVAWLCAPKNIMEKYLLLKNAADLSSSAIAQRQMAYYLDHYSLDSHIEWITGIYKQRRDLMAKIIDEKFPKTVGYKNPGGGLFIWLELPEGKDGRELLKRALKEKVSFIPGTSFYPAGDRHNEIRLNFSNMKPEKIIEGMSRLAEITKEYLKE
jgi:DNA-binding transcriptional MocR family regulator